MGFLPKIQALKLSPCDVLLFMSDVTPELLAVNGSKQPRGILFSYNQGMFCRGGFKAQTFPYPFSLLQKKCAQNGHKPFGCKAANPAIDY